MLTASAFAVQALQVRPLDLPTAATSSVCSLCGLPILAGDASGSFDTKAYGGLSHLAADQAPHSCQSCAAVLSVSEFMTTYSRAVFTPNHAFRMTQASDVAWMLFHAPTPFAAVFNMRKSAHVVCHAPVTLDRRLIGLVFGSTVASVRPDRVQAARSALARMTDDANAALGANYIWAVEGLSLRDDSFCELFPSHEHWLREHASPARQQDLDAFDGLNLAERWCLSALLLAAPKRDHPLVFNQPPAFAPVQAKQPAAAKRKAIQTSSKKA